MITKALAQKKYAVKLYIYHKFEVYVLLRVHNVRGTRIHKNSSNLILVTLSIHYVYPQINNAFLKLLCKRVYILPSIISFR